MAIRFQYNKTALQGLNKQLRIRQHALPILKSKEAALRMEVKKGHFEVEELNGAMSEKQKAQQSMSLLWEEFDFNLVRIGTLHVLQRKIAGVSIPVLDHIEFEDTTFSLYNRPAWFATGIEMMQEWMTLTARRKVLQQRVRLLEQARKKTTQKVNLYEKVQIPGFEEAIRKIKRYLEDEENLAKSAQKIVKTRHQEKNAVP